MRYIKTNPTPLIIPVNGEYYFRNLTDEQAGKLIKDLFAFHNRGIKRKYAVTNQVGHAFVLITSDMDDNDIYWNWYKGEFSGPLCVTKDVLE